jgi:FkbM family methyltransferase
MAIITEYIIDSKLSSFAQYIFDSFLATSGESTVARFKRIILGKVRNLILRSRDPVVIYNFMGYQLLLPYSHQLPYFRQSLPQYSLNLGRVAQNIEGHYPEMSVVDIGANVGDSLAILRSKVKSPVLCVEGDSKFFKILQHNAIQFENIFIEQTFIGDRSYLGKYRVVSSDGTARLFTDSAAEPIPILGIGDLLKKYEHIGETCKIIKIDTDGFDIPILLAASEILEKLKPVLFFEYDPFLFSNIGCDGFQIFDSLRDSGYRLAIFWENTGDYLLTVDILNTKLLEDLHNFYTGRNGSRYCDICLFHDDDRELCEELRISEIKFFDNFRKKLSE